MPGGSPPPPEVIRRYRRTLSMDFVLDLLQGTGIAAAVGIRPFLPVLLAGALASADLGLDFDGTDFAFLEAPGFLLAVLVAVMLNYIAERRLGPARVETWLLPLIVALGVLQGAASLADRDHPIFPGIVAGVLAALLGYFAVRSLFARVRRRLDEDAAGALPVYGEGAALGAAGASILFPPLAVLVLAALAWLLAGGRRRAGEKYAGLRILR
jgi:Na+-translocating ferredoxin:NAD+ oxidoreductase RnfA subunit